MNRLIVIICFYWPLCNSILQFQNLIARIYDNETIVRLIAYSNLALILIGIALLRKEFDVTSRTARLWIGFFILYFLFGILAIGFNGFDPSGITVALIPVIYFCGFYFLLSSKQYFKEFFTVLTVSFVISAFFSIILFKLNFDFASYRVYPWALDRAEGLYGDANNTALANIVAFILFDQFYKPNHRAYKLFKIGVLTLLFYSVFLTFSTTGLLAFLIVFFISKYEYFKGIRLVLLAVVVTLIYIGVFSLQSNLGAMNLTEAQVGKVENIINLLTFNIERVDSSGRIDLIDNILYYLQEHPIVGNGINFSAANKGHNTYLGVWVDAGIFTFLYFLFMLIYILFRSFTMKSVLRYLAISLLIVLYIFMMSLQTVINQPYLIVLFVLVCYLMDYSVTHPNTLGFLDKSLMSEPKNTEV